MRRCPEEPGIDEYTLYTGSRFATTFRDLKWHQVSDIAEGKRATDLESFLKPLLGWERVKVVCISMRASYRSLVRRDFPPA